MTSSNTGLIEISDGAQSLPQRQKETVGFFNPATFNSLGKGRCPAKQVNKTHLPVLPMALGAAAIPGAHGQPSSPRGAGVADREPCPRGSTSHGGPGRWPANAVLALSSHVPRCALARRSVTPGAGRLQGAQETRDGNNWQSSPGGTGVLGKVCGAPQLQAGSRGARTPSISASVCLFLAAQLKPPFVPKLSPFAQPSREPWD